MKSLPGRSQCSGLSVRRRTAEVLGDLLVPQRDIALAVVLDRTELACARSARSTEPHDGLLWLRSFIRSSMRWMQSSRSTMRSSSLCRAVSCSHDATRRLPAR